MEQHTTLFVLPLVLMFIKSQGFLFSNPGQATSPPMDNMIDTIKLRLYGRSLNEYEEYLLTTEADKLTNSSLFDGTRLTAVYSHGYTESPESESVKTVVSALMGTSKYNLIVVDWSKIAGQFYLVPALMTPEVGKLVAHRLDQWHREGVIPISNLYVIGHSLGGQVSGFIGKNVKEGKIPRITGLDPAFPGFSIRSFTSGHLTASDALFVDVIHTDGGAYGEPYPTGHADFYPNGGRRLQPGCPSGARLLTDEDFCSHWRSWRFYAESLNSALPQYDGLSCSAQADWEAGKCDGNPVAVMGYNTPNTTRGIFFLETLADAPFSKGSGGLVFSRRAGRRRKVYSKYRTFWGGR